MGSHHPRQTRLRMLPVLETVLAAFGARRPVRPTQLAATEPTTLLERSESSADIA